MKVETFKTDVFVFISNKYNVKSPGTENITL